MVEEVTRMMKEKHFDAVIASDEVMSHYALMLPNETVKLLDLHIVLNHLMQERFMHHRQHPQAARYWLSWKKVNRYEAFLFNRFDRLITVSEYEKQVSIENLGNVQPAISVIPNGAECIPNQADPIEKHETRLVYSGALTYDANYDAMAYFLSEIYPVIRRGRPDTTLMITGSLEGVKIDALAIDDSVTLTGYVNDVRPIVSSAAVCIVPLRFGGGTRLKILEALALGTPVVSTQKGVEGLALVHEQHLLVADTPADFASATLRLLSDPIVRERLREGGQRRVQELYDWERIGVDFAGVVEATIKSRKPI